MVGEAEAALLDEAGVHGLLFRPGFSTRDAVSATSGRGVGLDVVEDAVHRAGGTVAIASRPGEGTTFVLDLPLSAAMAPVLLVEAGGHAYALPAARVESVLHAEGIAGGDSLPPIVSLEAALGLPVPRDPGGIVCCAGWAGGRWGCRSGGSAGARTCCCGRCTRRSRRCRGWAAWACSAPGSRWWCWSRMVSLPD